MKRITSLSLLSVLPMLSLAAAPVIDSTGTVAVAPSQQSVQQAAATNNGVMVQQLQNLIQMNLPQQISQLEQNIQDMRGIIEIQGHQIQTMQKQLEQLTGKSLPATPVQNEAISQPSMSANNGGSLTASFNQDMSPTLVNKQQQKMVTASLASKPAVSLSTSMNSMEKNSAANTTATSSKADDKQKTLYEAAYSQIQSKSYTQATQGMKDYLSQYPAGTYAPNAHYWLGELYMISGNNQQATTEFATVVKDYPKSNKAADSMLKLGMLAMSVQDYKSAKTHFNALEKQFPKSPSTRIANEQLDQLARAGY